MNGDEAKRGIATDSGIPVERVYGADGDPAGQPVAARSTANRPTTCERRNIVRSINYPSP